jgi:hypothetical protein
MPMSMPAAEVEGWTGFFSSRSVRIEINPLPAVCRTVTLLASPEDLPAVGVADPAEFRTYGFPDRVQILAGRESLSCCPFLLNSGGSTRLIWIDLAGLQLLERFSLPVPRIFEILQGTVATPARTRTSTRTSAVLPSNWPSLPRTRHSQDGSRISHLLLERESTVEDQAARAGKPAHRMRLFFIDSQLKLVPQESSWSRVIVETYSPIVLLNSLRLTRLFLSIQAQTRFKKTVRHKHVSRCYPSPASMPGPLALFRESNRPVCSFANSTVLILDKCSQACMQRSTCKCL